MDDLLRKRQLNRMKLIATGLMLLMVLILIYSRLQQGRGIWHWVTAFSEAALVGALADWFAVVALFRHPLKLPIPRTAIIPENKERIAENMAAFIRNNFLSADILMERMRALEPAQRIGAWLSSRDKADMISRQIILVLVSALAFIDDQRVGRILRNTIYRRLEQADLGNLVGQLLDVLTQNDQHQALLNEGLRRLSTVLDEPDTQRQVAAIIIEVSRREHPKLLAMLGIVMDTREFGMRLSATMVESMQNWLHDIGQDPEHPRRKQFDSVVENFLSGMKNDPVYHQRVESWKQQLLTTPVVAEYCEALWIQLRRWLQQDAARSEPRMQVRFSHALRHFGRWMLDNPELCDSVNEHLIKNTSLLSEELRASVSRHIVSTIVQWDDKSLVSELELTVGRDLQFIRINGTLVGGIIGVILHAFVLWLGNL
ncbi:MAG: DUF445 domain-containing protein [Burkholderiaceae bacterium]|jgi:uncharacterized membrane-anchored protein YjiN (DUF445 family)|nr:DUF445 domain-containing protein [Burkholderiaceae bacterium]